MANISKFDPFAELQAMQKQFFGNPWFAAGPSSMPMQTTDVYTEDGKRLIIEVHLPHFDQKDINISVDNGVLEIQAEKHEKDEDKGRKYVVRESSSSFYRRVRLPEQADIGKIAAHMDNGVLKVTVPFKKLPAPKKVAIGSPKSPKKR